VKRKWTGNIFLSEPAVVCFTFLMCQIPKSYPAISQGRMSPVQDTVGTYRLRKDALLGYLRGLFPNDQGIIKVKVREPKQTIDTATAVRTPYQAA
jgi:hypothetical protein